MNRFVATFFLLTLCVSVSRAFQIDLPKHYAEDLSAKREKESNLLWNELDRTAIETELISFVAANPKIDGVDISPASKNLVWMRTLPRSTMVGPWFIALKEWEMCFPSLKRIDWGKATLVVSLSYKYKEKEICEGGDGEIRLYFSLRRVGGIFARKTIYPTFLSSDFGEATIQLPLGGVELQKKKTLNSEARQ